MSEPLGVIPFGEICPEASVRVALINGVQYLSVRDFIMAMCGQNHVHASKTWSRISETFKEEVSTFCQYLKFKGPGQKEQPVIQFQGAIKLMMQLPGERAKQFRSKASEILTRYYAGDKTLLVDVEANAESGASINEAARAALPDVMAELDNKRRRIVTISDKELAKLTSVTAHMKEQNAFLREHIQLKREFYGIELSYERDKLGVAGQARTQELEHESAKVAIIDKERKSEIEYKKALKAIESGTVVEPPTPFTTVLKVFNNHRGEFNRITSKNKDRLLCYAGKKVAELYRKDIGMYPLTTMQDNLEVKQYPVEWDNVILEALRAVSKDILAGSNQQHIDGMFIRTERGQDTIVNLSFGAA
jgi:hypothetical protein